MAEIVTSPIETSTQAISSAFAPLKYLIQHAIPIIMLIVFCVAIGVGLYFWYKKQDLQQQEADTLYKEYKNTISSCEINKDTKRYIKKYSKLNILFCLGLPFIKKTIGRNYYNERQEFIGFYDGHFIDNFGNYNVLLWKNKTLGILKNYFILRVPTKIYSLSKDKKEINSQKLKINNLVETHQDKTTSIKMINMQKKGYYFYPTIRDDNKEVLDLSGTINSINYINHNGIMLESVIKESGKNVVGMAKINTKIQYEQRVPEKVREVDREEY